MTIMSFALNYVLCCQVAIAILWLWDVTHYESQWANKNRDRWMWLILFLLAPVFAPLLLADKIADRFGLYNDDYGED